MKNEPPLWSTTAALHAKRPNDRPPGSIQPHTPMIIPFYRKCRRCQKQKFKTNFRHADKHFLACHDCRAEEAQARSERRLKTRKIT